MRTLLIKVMMFCLAISLVTGCNNDEPKRVSFLVIGDWGNGSQDQIDVANAMKTYCVDNKCEFVLTTGDNFYRPLTDANDPLWQTIYSDVYGELGLVFYPALGNHDMGVNFQAETGRAAIDPTWHMPSEYYSFAKPDGEGDPVIEFFVLNSGDYQFQDDERTWLENALASSKAAWKILVTHVPIISNGPHGDDEHGMNAALIPVICGKVNLVLSGHDHIFSYLKSVVNGCDIEQVIVGDSGATLYEAKPDSRVISSGSFFGFGVFKVTESEMSLSSIQSDGSVYFTTSWSK